MRRFTIILLAILLIYTLVFGGCTNQSVSPTPLLRNNPESVSVSGKTIELIFAYWPPPEADISRFGWEAWGDEIENITNGRVRVKFYGGSALGAPNDHYKLATTGTADISVFVPEFTPGVFPFSSIANLPMLFPSSEAAALALHRFHTKYTANTELKDVKLLAVSPTAPAQLLTRTKQVRILRDLQGMKIATTSNIQADLISLLGATPIFMTDRILYTSLDKGLTDGRFTEWDGAIVWEVMKVTTFRTANINLALNQMLVVMNLDSWNKLPSDIQNIITGSIGLHLSRHLGMIFDRANNKNLLVLKEYDQKSGNPEIYWLPDDERQTWAEVVQPFTEHWVVESEALGYPATAALEDVKAWLEEDKAIYESGVISSLD
jgi:TRAP-type C4-dicarboxylate transport system substrate-binding protein